MGFHRALGDNQLGGDCLFVSPGETRVTISCSRLVRPAVDLARGAGGGFAGIFSSRTKAMPSSIVIASPRLCAAS